MGTVTRCLWSLSRVRPFSFALLSSAVLCCALLCFFLTPLRTLAFQPSSSSQLFHTRSECEDAQSVDLSCIRSRQHPWPPSRLDPLSRSRELRVEIIILYYFLHFLIFLSCILLPQGSRVLQ